jgi:hypothetical protein
MREIMHNSRFLQTRRSGNYAGFGLNNNHAVITILTFSANPQVRKLRTNSRQSRAPNSRFPPPLEEEGT